MSLSMSISYYPYNFPITNRLFVSCGAKNESILIEVNYVKISNLVTSCHVLPCSLSINETRTDQAITNKKEKKQQLTNTTKSWSRALYFGRINSIWISHVLIADRSQSLSQEGFSFFMFFFSLFFFAFSRLLARSTVNACEKISMQLSQLNHLTDWTRPEMNYGNKVEIQFRLIKFSEWLQYRV